MLENELLLDDALLEDGDDGDGIYGGSGADILLEAESDKGGAMVAAAKRREEVRAILPIEREGCLGAVSQFYEVALGCQLLKEHTGTDGIFEGEITASARTDD